MTDTPKLSAPFETQFHKGRLDQWIIQNLIRQIHTAELVKVLAVYPTEDKVGFVDVQPLVQERTTRDVVLEQSPIFKVPFARVQGGKSALIIDPVIGDIGLAIFAQRDITNVIATGEQGAAPTDRAYSSADGLYLGGFLNMDATQFLQFFPTDGAQLVAPLLTLDAEVRTTGNVKVGTGISTTKTMPDGSTLTWQDGILVNEF